MRKFCHGGLRVLLAAALLLSLAAPAGARKGKRPADLAQILDQMSEVSKRLKTVSAVFEYTKFTQIVNDKSTESGHLSFRKGKSPEIRLDILKPEAKTLLLKNNKGESYSPKINEVMEYDLKQKGDVVQQILLLGFGSDPNDLKKSFEMKYLREEDLGEDTNVLLELVPRKSSLSGQFTKIEMWISEESWLPTQQKFYQQGGDYLIAHYSSVKVNKPLDGSVFELNVPANAKRVRMN